MTVWPLLHPLVRPAAQRGAPPQVNVIATAMFAVAMVAMLLGLEVQRRRAL